MYKKVSFSFIVALFSFISFISFSEETEEVDRPEFEWVKTVHEFGEIKHNIPASISFEFKNNGNKPLIITNVVPSCGCSVAEFPKKAIMPGETGVIKGTYNAANLGTFSKVFTVNSNTGVSQTLKIKGKVVR